MNLLQEREGILLLLAIVVLPFAIYFDNKMKKKRYAEYAKMGFSPSTKRKFLRWTKLERFSILAKMGLFRSANEYMSGVYRGHMIGLFLHVVADGSKTGKQQTAAIISLESTLPHFVLRPEWFKDKVKARFGEEDINFGNDELFSKKYFLQGRKADDIKKLFSSAKVRNYFSRQNDMWLESNGSKLLIFQEHDVLTDGKQMRRIVERAIHVKALLEGLDDNREAIGHHSANADSRVPVQMPPSIEWNAANIMIILSVLTVVIGILYSVYKDSKEGYDARMAMYHQMTTEEMASYLADLNSESHQLDAVTRHTGADANGTAISYYRELEWNLLSDMIVDVNDMDTEKAKMTRQLKREACGLPTWDLFYEKGGQLIYVYHLVKDENKTFMFEVKVDQQLCTSSAY